MMAVLWTIAFIFSVFCFLPTCNIKIAQTYSRWFKTNVYTDIWYKMFYVGVSATVVLMFINLLIGE